MQQTWLEVGPWLVAEVLHDDPNRVEVPEAHSSDDARAYQEQVSVHSAEGHETHYLAGAP